MAWCLIKKYADSFREALKDGTIDPVNLSTMTSEERRNFLAQYVGEENAVNVNSLFESKLLLKNQQRGMVSWAKRVMGMSAQRKADLITRIERMDRVLSPAENEQFLADLASTKLKVEVTQEEAQQIYELSEKNRQLREAIPADSPIRSKARIDYGIANSILKDHMAKLKADAGKLSIREEPARYLLDVALKTIPNLSQSIRTAYDNSVWLRQLNSALFTPRYSKIWSKGFVDSWRVIAKELKGQDAMLLIRADVYSRPNALNGKYDADPSGYGLGIKSEEVYMSEIPAKIPVLGRIFRASQSAYNGGALKVRADVADLEIMAAETAGQNVMDKKVAQSISSMVGSITGRGSVSSHESLLRLVLWSPRFYVSQIHQLTAHVFDPKATAYTRKRSAINLATMLGVYTVLFTIAKALDPDSVDEKEHLGKIKIWGKWVDMTGGKAAWAKLVMDMSKKLRKSFNGEEFGYMEYTAWDTLINFAQGKLSPTAGVIRDILKGKFYSGEPVTFGKAIKEYFTPITSGTFEDLAEDPTASNVFGLIVLELLGANVSSWLEGNTKTKIIPTDTVIKADDFMSMVLVYAVALESDPETAFNRIFTGQRIVQISPNKIIVVERDDQWDERKKEYAKKYGVSAEDIKEVREEHIIPIKGGGADADTNRVMVSKSLWTEFTKVDNAYIKARKDGIIDKIEGEKLISDYKYARISGKTKPTQEDILKRLQ